jgi:hypothetical protein
MSKSKPWYPQWKKEITRKIREVHGYLPKDEYRKRLKVEYEKELSRQQDMELDEKLLSEARTHSKQ